MEYTYYVVFSFEGGKGSTVVDLERPIRYYSDVTDLVECVRKACPDLKGVIIENWIQLETSSENESECEENGNEEK